MVILKSIPVKVEIFLATFWPSCGKMWLLLIPTSGHTELCESEPGSAKDAEACGLMAAAVLLHKPFFLNIFGKFCSTARLQTFAYQSLNPVFTLTASTTTRSKKKLKQPGTRNRSPVDLSVPSILRPQVRISSTFFRQTLLDP